MGIFKKIKVIIFVPPSSYNRAQSNYHLKFGRDKIKYSKLSFSHIICTLYFILKICLSILQTVICLSIKLFSFLILCISLQVIGNDAIYYYHDDNDVVYYSVV